MKKIFLVVLLIVVAGFVFVQAAFAQQPDATELLRSVEKNEIFDSIEYEGEMEIHHGGRRFVKTMKAWARGNTHNFTEFTNREDRGTKYLRRDGRLYVYSPDNEGVMLISGHMLRESMMGSDMSYEDMMDNEPLSNRYNAVISGSEIVTVNGVGRDCWVLNLTARRRTESYPQRKLWIDKANNDMLRYELFALSGVKLKEYNMLRIENIGGRRFPVETEIRDLLRRDSRTIFRMKNVKLDIPIPESIFSMRNLER
jgi:outer membrane lipoprotein-sorting protein